MAVLFTITKRLDVYGDTMWKMYPYSTGPSTRDFSTRPCENTFHPSNAFKQYKSSAHHKRLEEKLTDNSVSVYEQMVVVVE